MSLPIRLMAFHHGSGRIPDSLINGGTDLATTFDGATRNSAYVSEEAYADPLTEDIFFGTSATGSVWGSGGGDSVIFTKPIYQFLVSTGNKSFRTVPDVALHMGGCPVVRSRPAILQTVSTMRSTRTSTTG
ncbi:hypothetical protein [Granulicella arctica]|uniref:hypothetical protein n=1 Tax=Granulicella arctica TaxID=940613 RepID=UPI0021DFF60B|nr:hypothetical protein [Granulicella arctica]